MSLQPLKSECHNALVEQKQFGACCPAGSATSPATATSTTAAITVTPGSFSSISLGTTTPWAALSIVSKLGDRDSLRRLEQQGGRPHSIAD